MGTKGFGKTLIGERGLWEVHNYAIFVAATPNYIAYLNPLLNSIEKRKLYEHCNLTVYVFYTEGFCPEYIDIIKQAYSFTVYPMKMVRSDFPELNPKMKEIEFVKRTRYKKMIQLALEYEAVCLLDCDMFVVSEQFIDLFNLIKGTDYCIGCNERFKWSSGAYKFNDKELLIPRGGKMFQFVCNTPAIMDMHKWRPVFEAYCKIASGGTQIKHGGVKGIGDITCWNLATMYCAMNDKMIMFPMETMAQVHQTYFRNRTYPIDENGYWYTFSGDRIYTIHGRVARPNFVEGVICGGKGYRELHKGRPDIDKVEIEVRKGLKAIQKEWYDLNYNGKVNLDLYYKYGLKKEMENGFN